MFWKIPTTLVASAVPGTEPQKFRWESSDELVATVDDNGVVTAVSPGVATISATTHGNEYANAVIIVTDLGPFQLIAANYDDKGRLATLKAWEKTVNNGRIDLELEPGLTYKIFFWDAQYVPLLPVLELDF